MAANLIILEELPMSNVAVFETIDTCLRSVMKSDLPFGGKLILGIGDFRQVGPVILGGGHIEAYDASIKSSTLWPLFEVLTLGTPLRYGHDAALCAFIDCIGDGWDLPEVELSMFDKILSLEEASHFLYPDHILSDWETCMGRAFISPRNILVDEFNQIILNQLPGEECTCLHALLQYDH
jgi:hypothetical protein